MTAPTEGTVSQALSHSIALPALRNPVAIRGCVIVHTPVSSELYFKHARALEHVISDDLINVIGSRRFARWWRRRRT